MVPSFIMSMEFRGMTRVNGGMTLKEYMATLYSTFPDFNVGWVLQYDNVPCHLSKLFEHQIPILPNYRAKHYRACFCYGKMIV